MVDREAERAAVVPAVARVLRSRDFRSEIVGRMGQSHRVVVVLDDDPMSYLFARLADAAGTAVVAMRRGESFRVALMQPASEARVQVACEDDKLSLIHDDSPVGMFFAYLEQVDSCVISRTAAQLIDDRELELA